VHKIVSPNSTSLLSFSNIVITGSHHKYYNEEQDKESLQ